MNPSSTYDDAPSIGIRSYGNLQRHKKSSQPSFDMKKKITSFTNTRENINSLIDTKLAHLSLSQNKQHFPAKITYHLFHRDLESPHPFIYQNDCNLLWHKNHRILNHRQKNSPHKNATCSLDIRNRLILLGMKSPEIFPDRGVTSTRINIQNHHMHTSSTEDNIIFMKASTASSMHTKIIPPTINIWNRHLFQKHTSKPILPRLDKLSHLLYMKTSHPTSIYGIIASFISIRATVSFIDLTSPHLQYVNNHIPYQHVGSLYPSLAHE